MGLNSVSIEFGNDQISYDEHCVYDISGRDLIRVFADVTHFHVGNHVEVLCEECCAHHSSLRQVTFEDGSQLKCIEAHVFDGTAVDSIRIPKGVTSLSALSLVHLKSVSIDDENQHFSCEDGCVYDKSGRHLVRLFAQVPSFCVAKHIGVLCEHCFARCSSLKQVTFEEGSELMRIEKKAFAFSGVTSIRIPANVEILCERCFYSCHSLQQVTFDKRSQLKRIEKGAFACKAGYGYSPEYCRLSSIPIPAGVEVLCERCFFRCCSLRQVTFQKGSRLKRIEGEAFLGTRVSPLRIPQGTEVAPNAYCSFERIPDELSNPSPELAMTT
jgi:hypothetical protein